MRSQTNNTKHIRIDDNNNVKHPIIKDITNFFLYKRDKSIYHKYLQIDGMLFKINNFVWNTFFQYRYLLLESVHKIILILDKIISLLHKNVLQIAFLFMFYPFVASKTSYSFPDCLPNIVYFCKFSEIWPPFIKI